MDAQIGCPHPPLKTMMRTSHHCLQWSENKTTSKNLPSCKFQSVGWREEFGGEAPDLLCNCWSISPKQPLHSRKTGMGNDLNRLPPNTIFSCEKGRLSGCQMFQLFSNTQGAPQPCSQELFDRVEARLFLEHRAKSDLPLQLN